MTTRLTTTLGALALGIAAFAASPVLAQGAGAGGAAGGGGTGGGNVPGQTPTTTNPGAGNPGPAGNATNNGNPATTGTLGQGMVRPMHHPSMESSSTRHMSHHASMHTRHGRAGASTSASEGDAAVARLNEQSLMAAQKGTNFMPNGASQ